MQVEVVACNARVTGEPCKGVLADLCTQCRGLSLRCTLVSPSELGSWPMFRFRKFQDMRFTGHQSMQTLRSGSSL